jgi:hypothetical protein
MRPRVFLSFLLVVPLAAACGDDGSGPGGPPPTARWNQVTGGVGESNFRAVWGTSIDSLLAVGAEFPLLSAVGGEWAAVPLPEDCVALDAIWANAPDDIFVGGYAGAAFHYDGNAWSSIPANSTTSFLDLCATPDGEVYACVEEGSGPAVLRRTDAGWEYFAGGFQESAAIWATGNDSIYLAGQDGYAVRFDGVEWLPVSRIGGFDWLDAWGTPDDVVYFVGQGGHLARWFYFVFQEITSPVTTTLRAVSGISATNIIAVGDEGTIIHFDGNAWTPRPPVTAQNLLAVHVFEDGSAVALGADGTVLVFDGLAWRAVHEGDPAVWVDAFGFDAADVFFAGYDDEGGVVQHLDGRTWTFPGQRLNGVWGLARDDVIVVGDFGACHHFDGGTWTPMTNGSILDLTAVAGADDKAGARAYAVGDNANLRFSAPPFSGWTAMLPPSTPIYDIRDVWAAAPDNVFAVGPSATILRYLGNQSSRWTTEETGVAGGFVAIAGRGESDVTALTGDGHAFHFDGSRWREIDIGLRAPWVDVACGPRGGLLAVSSLPRAVMISAFDLAGAAEPDYLGRFYSGWITAGTAYAGGAEGAIFRCEW